MIERSDTEEVDALPVLAPEAKPPALAPRAVAPALGPRAVAPAVQAAAVAAGGFVAGAVVVGVLGRRGRRALASRAPRRLVRRKRAPGELVEIVASRSLLVDVHLLGSPSSPARGR